MADVTSCELYSYFRNNFIVRSNVEFFIRRLSQSIVRVTVVKQKNYLNLINTVFFSEKRRISFFLFVYIVVFLFSIKLHVEVRVNANNTKLD